jgi:dolichyl-phosphate-mannose--protein O-mannosyl transferase
MTNDNRSAIALTMLASLRILLKDKPWIVALLLGLAAQLLFTLHIDRPGRIMFDEVHYVPAAKALLALSEPRNEEHPLLGKELIAVGIAVFGDNPVGWRIMSSFAATATVIGGFALVWLLLGAVRPAVIAAVLLALNQLVFIQGRIGMLDSFLAPFILWAMTLMLWAMRAEPKQVRRRWIGASVLLGLAVAVKWAAVPYVALAGLAFIVLRIRAHWQVSPRGWSVSFGKAFGAALSAKDQPIWRGLGTIPGLALLGAVSIAVYFLTFLPAFFYAEHPMMLAGLLPYQAEMYALQTQVLRSHPYQSSWWTWPFMVRPIWYWYEPDDGIQRGVLLIGNPLIMWGGLVAVLAGIIAWFRGGAIKPLAMTLLWVASVAMYAIIPKSLGFYYYYYLSGIFLCLAIPVAFHHFDRGRNRGLEDWFAAASLLVFIYFYPIISGAALADAQSFQHWMWFDSWR